MSTTGFKEPRKWYQRIKKTHESMLPGSSPVVIIRMSPE